MSARIAAEAPGEKNAGKETRVALITAVAVHALGRPRADRALRLARFRNVRADHRRGASEVARE